MISRTISGEEQQAGAPDGLILMPTTSFGSINFAHAACADFSPVNSNIARSSMPCTIGCETRFRMMALGSRISTTRPGKSPGIPSGDGFVSGQTAEFDGWHCRRRHVGSHHRIKSLNQQRSASNAAGFHERTAIHGRFLIRSVQPVQPS